MSSSRTTRSPTTEAPRHRDISSPSRRLPPPVLPHCRAALESGTRQPHTSAGASPRAAAREVHLRAAWYDEQGSARDVLRVGELPDPTPAPGEVRIRIAASGINPGDIKKRQNAFGYAMSFPRVIPHSDGAGVIDVVGADVPQDVIGRRVWCYGAQSYRPFGTAAEFTVVPLSQAVPLPDHVPFDQGACLGIPGITAHRCVHVAGTVQGRVVLVQGGAVGLCAVQLARPAAAVHTGRTTRHVRRTWHGATRAGASDRVASCAGAVPRLMASTRPGSLLVSADGTSPVSTAPRAVLDQCLPSSMTIPRRACIAGVK
jgi:Zn-dependent alcohol dehydrogenase